MIPPNDIITGSISSRYPSENSDLLSLVFDYETVQLGAGDFCRNLDFAATGAFVVYNEQVGAKLHSFGTIREGLLAVCLADTRNSTWWGSELQNTEVPLCPSGADVEVGQVAGLGQSVLLWNTKEIQNLLDTVTLDDDVLRRVESLQAQGVQGGMTLHSGAQNLRNWGQFIGSLVSSMSAHQMSLSAERFNDLGVGALLSILDEMMVGEMQRSLSRSRALDLVSRAVELDARMLYVPCIIPVLAGHLGCSRRKLELAFKEVVGDSPLRYLNRRRMNHAFQDLSNGSLGQETVTAVAARYGFAELGRFSGAYKKLFGEMPSKTLKSWRKPSRIILPSWDQKTQPSTLHCKKGDFQTFDGPTYQPN